MSPKTMQQLIDDFQHQKLLIIGDIMLDCFVYGSASRISPEAPVAVLSHTSQKLMAGGAGNVAANIASLGGKAHVISITGDDSDGKALTHILQDLNIQTSLFTDPSRSTTRKTRFIAQSQQLLRVDEEYTQAIDQTLEQQILATVQQYLPSYDAIILSDYAKGALTKNLVPQLITLAKSHEKPILIDPKGTDWSHYRGATLLSPNIKEAYDITGILAYDDQKAEEAAQHIRKTYELSYLLLTRSEQGMSLASKDKTHHIRAQALEVMDVSGAGDTVIASLSLALCAGADISVAARIATIAAAIAVEKLGTACVQTEELLQRLEQSLYPYDDTPNPLSKLLKRIASWRRRGFKIGFTNGCFDLLHAGHLHTFIEGKNHCDRLIVAVNSDDSIRRLKGDDRPVQTLAGRVKLLSHLREVDAVCSFDDDTPITLIEAIKPDVLIKGGDYTMEDIVGYDIVTNNGGKVITIPLVEGISTTKTIEKITQKKE